MTRTYLLLLFALGFCLGNICQIVRHWNFPRHGYFVGGWAVCKFDNEVRDGWYAIPSEAHLGYCHAMRVKPDKPFLIGQVLHKVEVYDVPDENFGEIEMWEKR